MSSRAIFPDSGLYMLFLGSARVGTLDVPRGICRFRYVAKGGCDRTVATLCEKIVGKEGDVNASLAKSVAL